MEKITIAQAVKTLENALIILDDGYWGASQMSHKDHLYNLISVLQKELNELAKLSVEDHYMAYEPVTVTFRNSSNTLRQLQNQLHDWVTRTETASNLENELPHLLHLVSPSFK